MGKNKITIQELIDEKGRCIRYIGMLALIKKVMMIGAGMLFTPVMQTIVLDKDLTSHHAWLILLSIIGVELIGISQYFESKHTAGKEMANDYIQKWINSKP